MNKHRYVYPALFHYADDGISVEFPDLPGCLTCGDNTEEALLMAKDALELHLIGMKKDGEELPTPEYLPFTKLKSNECIAFIEVFITAQVN